MSPDSRQEHQLSPVFKEFFEIAEAARRLPTTELLNAWAELDLLRSKTLEEMSRFPVLLCPVASVPAFRHDERSWIVEGKTVEYLDAWRYTQWFNSLARPPRLFPSAFTGGIADRRADCSAALRR